MLLYYSAGSGDSDFEAGKPSQTYVLDLKANAWKKQESETVPPPRLIPGSAACDANHIVMWACINGNLWACRDKGGCPADAFKPGG